MKSDKDYLGFGNKSQVGDAVWAIFWMFLIGWCVLSLYGCATFEPRVPQVNRILIGNQVVTEWTDAADAPETCGGAEYVSCYTYKGGRIDYKSPVSQWMKDHERAHAAGMIHGGYSVDFSNRNCAPVLTSGGKYHAGDRICISQRGEDLIPAAYFAEAK